MRLLLDTNRLGDTLNQDAKVISIIELAIEVFVPFIALAEIQAGFLGGSPKRLAHNEALLARLLQMPSVFSLYPDRGTNQIYAQLYDQLREAGTPIPTNDLWIASLAVQHNLTLLTRDRHFARIPQVSRA